MTSSSLESWHSLLLVAVAPANKGGGDVGSFGGTAIGSLLLEDGELEDDTFSDLAASVVVDVIFVVVVVVVEGTIGVGNSLLFLELISCFSAFVDSIIWLLIWLVVRLLISSLRFIDFFGEIWFLINSVYDFFSSTVSSLLFLYIF